MFACKKVKEDNAPFQDYEVFGYPQQYVFRDLPDDCELKMEQIVMTQDYQKVRDLTESVKILNEMML